MECWRENLAEIQLGRLLDIQVRLQFLFTFCYNKLANEAFWAMGILAVQYLSSLFWA